MLKGLIKRKTKKSYFNFPQKRSIQKIGIKNQQENTLKKIYSSKIHPYQINLFGISNKLEKRNFSSVDQKEIDNFSKLSSEWWEPNGKMKTLHDINPLRVQFIHQSFKKYSTLEIKKEDLSNLKKKKYLPLQGLKILDVGCGAGLFSEACSRLGANVIGLDASKTNIEVAKLHSEKHLKENRPQYIYSTIEEFLKNEKEMKENFDLVCALEVIEHVQKTDEFLKNLASLTKLNGSLVISTLNQTFKSYLFGIVVAEHLLSLIPQGTHSWDKFIQPKNLQNQLENLNFKIMETKGIGYNPLNRNSWLMDDTSINYIMFANKLE